jgi:hypothetical protein
MRILAAALIVAFTGISHAAPINDATVHQPTLPAGFLGSWHGTQIQDSHVHEYDAEVTDTGLHEGGYHCNIKNVQRRRDNAGLLPIYQVDMVCNDEGPRPLYLQSVWALRLVSSGDVLVITTLPDQIFDPPSIEVFERGTSKR